MRYQIWFGILVITACCCPPPGEGSDEGGETEALEERLAELEKELAEANANPPGETSDEVADPGEEALAAPAETEELAVEPVPLDAGDDPCDGIRSRSAVPQVPGRSDLFTELRERPQPQGDLEQGLVICRIVTRGSFDAFKGPDLSAKVKMGDFGPKTIRGGEDQWTMHVSLPAVTLRKGKIIRFNLWDRDVFGSDAVGSARRKYPGQFPFYLDHANMDVECRAMEKGQVDKEVGDRLARLDKLLTRAPRTFRPQPKQWDWGLRETALGEACQKLNEVQGFVGTDDTRTDGPTDKIRALVGQWRGVATQSVEKVRKTLPEPGEGGAATEGTRVTVLSVRKNTVTLKVENLGAEECKISPFLGHVCTLNRIGMVGADGRPEAAKIVTPASDAVIVAGGSLEVTLRGGSEPVLLRVAGWNDKRLLRLR